MRGFKYILLAVGLVVILPLHSLVSAADTSAPAEGNTPSRATSSDSLSTSVGDLDAMGVVPDVIETPYEGGTRRVHIESTVFRRESPVVYSSGSRRDPFRPLLSDQKGQGTPDTDLLVVDGANLTGVVWAEGHYLAMVRDKDARTFFLREGDPVYRGRVTTVAQTHIVIELSGFGEYRQVTLKVND
jgi:hypothetical protein